MSKPRRTWNGCHGDSFVFSPKHIENLPGNPWVAWSITPGRAPPILIQANRAARPIAALARVPGPRQPVEAFMPMFSAAGPLTRNIAATGLVVGPALAA